MLSANAEAVRRSKSEGLFSLASFGLSIPTANWLIDNAGTVCVANGPCLIPVAPRVMAPSGVLMVGLAPVPRDLVQRRLGMLWAVGAILAGAALSAALAPPALIVASTAAFLLSLYQPVDDVSVLITKGQH